MSDPFVAEIRMVPFNFAPTGWAFCDGQIMPISQNTALFSLLGTTYGGDGKSTFALPNLQGTVPMHPGQGQGLSLRDLGEMSGSESVTLLVSEIPLHTHTIVATADSADDNDARPTTTFAAAAGGALYNSGPVTGSSPTMSASALTLAGGGLPHNNLQPYLVVNFIIAMQGVFPQRP
jgi:microcystin-dependent protein